MLNTGLSYFGVGLTNINPLDVAPQSLASITSVVSIRKWPVYPRYVWLTASRPSLEARFVIIQQPVNGAGHLNMAEVEVYAADLPPKSESSTQNANSMIYSLVSFIQEICLVKL